MYRLTLLFAIALLAPQLKANCQTLLDLKYPEIEMYHAEFLTEPVPHCKAKGLIGSKINFSLWLPQAWNGRFVMGGAGGFVQPEDNQALRFIGERVLKEGYATASTDTGHQSNGRDNTWGLNDYEAIVNYAYLGMHRAVVASKAVIADHYGQASEKSFFVGCSNGGRQGLHEAQRYPEDFDGIVSGAPALNFSGVAAAFVNVTRSMFPDPNDLSAALVSLGDRRLLRKRLLAACDENDGLADNLLHDPTACNFDPGVLTCAVGQETECLSADKVAAIKTVYAGPHNSNGALFFGFPFGAEDIETNGWGSWLTGGAESGSPNAAYDFGVGMLRNFVTHNPNWTYEQMDWDTFPDLIRPVGHLLDANNPDLTQFRARGGKLLMFHGWADAALSAHMSTDYVDRVYAHDRTAQDDVRLFMMPGVLHCRGGAAPSVVDWLEVLEDWHETDRAPTELAATYPDRPGDRKICAWPQKAAYQGGDPDSAAAYLCVQ